MVYSSTTVGNFCCTYIHSCKIGIDGVNSNLATAIRTVVVVVMAWGMVFLTRLIASGYTEANLTRVDGNFNNNGILYT